MISHRFGSIWSTIFLLRSILVLEEGAAAGRTEQIRAKHVDAHHVRPKIICEHQAESVLFGGKFNPRQRR